MEVSEVMFIDLSQIAHAFVYVFKSLEYFFFLFVPKVNEKRTVLLETILQKCLNGLMEFRFEQELNRLILLING